MPNIKLPNHQDALIAAVAAAQPKTVAVLETGGPVLMPWIEKVPAVVQAWYPGQRGGEAIANILTGNASSNRLVGNSGNDTIFGAAAYGDTLNGGVGDSL